ncbi:MAG: serpin family protein [bacterium]
MKIIHFILLICVGIILTQCEHNPVSSDVRDLTGLEKRLVESDNKFGFKLFKEIVKAEPDTNIFISPLSVSMALGMTLNGANGETKAAMEQTLELVGLTTEEINQSYQSLIELLTQLDPKVVFQIANSIWYRQEMTFEEEFINLNKTFFDALVQGLDFNDPNSVNIINGWVKDNTNGKIEKILENPIDPNTVMFLINAIYFYGTWKYEFDKEMTQDDFFTLPDGSYKACQMMVQTGEFNYLENDDFQAIDLPYGGEDFRMTIFLPKPTKSIDSLIAEFDETNWNSWLSSFSKDSVTLELPKFELEYEIKLNDILAALGMGIAFTPQADFTRMYKRGGLWIDYVKHKTFVEVNEEGTEAAAVTIVAIIKSANGSSGIRFMRVDRPFIFVIRENHSQTLLFIGKIVEPYFE